MDSNTERPKWLTAEKIAQYKELLKNVEPYTEEEMVDIPFDGNVLAEYDIYRMHAYHVQKVLKEYGLL